MDAEAELRRVLSEREQDVAELVRSAEHEARAEVAERLRRLFAEDLLRRALETLEERRPGLALAGIVEEAGELVPITTELDESRLRTPEELEAAAKAHNALLLGREDVLPFRFGTVFESREKLTEWLRVHEAGLRAELERLRGAEEWGVELVGPEPTAAETGGGYLEQRRAAGVATAERARLIERCRAQLADAALEANRDAYLVRDSEAFEAALESLRGEGLELRVTGPWPPYSFARLP